MESNVMAIAEALPAVEAETTQVLEGGQPAENSNAAAENPARQAFIKYDMDNHYQCYKCGDMFDKKTHGRLGTPKRPFVMKELCPKCYADSNIARARDVDALSGEVAKKYGLTAGAAREYVEEAVRSKA